MTKKIKITFLQDNTEANKDLLKTTDKHESVSQVPMSKLLFFVPNALAK
jgi:hypothetical protein